MLQSLLCCVVTHRKPGKFGPCTQTRWDSWGRFVEPLTANVPLMTLPGNHEVEQDGAPPATQTQFLAYSKRMRMPTVEGQETL